MLDLTQVSSGPVPRFAAPSSPAASMVVSVLEQSHQLIARFLSSQGADTIAHSRFPI